MKKIILLSLTAICMFSTSVYAQRGGGQPATKSDQLDPTPVDAATDPNIDLFINDYRTVTPRFIYGKLAVHDLLTKLQGADPQHPSKKGAVLTNISAISYAALAPGAVAAGRSAKGERQVFFTNGGEGQITVNGKSFDVKDGVGFILFSNFDFKLTSTGKEPLVFYVRTENVPDSFVPPEFSVVNALDNERRVGAHWVHINSGGVSGLTLITIAPHTMPQPHSHPQEECWIMIKGESILSLGKNIRRMESGQAYKIPPTGITAHSNINTGDEPVEMLYLGPYNGNGGPGGGGRGGRGGAAGGAATGAAPNVARASAPTDTAAIAPPAAAGRVGNGREYAALEGGAISVPAEHDIDMYIANWREAYPRILHANLICRDMLTPLDGSDPLHPAKRGAVLAAGQNVSFAQLEPGASAHRLDGELNGIQETYIVNSGTGFITSNGKKTELAKDMAFTLTPGMDFKIAATGGKYLSFYVVTEKIPQGFTPKTILEVVDNRTKPAVTKNWFDAERPLVTKEDGLSEFSSITSVELPSMKLSQPYSAAKGAEDIWIATDGQSDMLLGKELRTIIPGMAYLLPPTGVTANGKLNTSAKPVTYIHITN